MHFWAPVISFEPLHWRHRPTPEERVCRMAGTSRFASNIHAVEQQLINQIQEMNLRYNASIFLPACLDLHFGSFYIHIWHELLPADFARRHLFSEWLLHCCHTAKFLDCIEATVAINSQVNVVQHTPAKRPPEFNFMQRIIKETVTVWIAISSNNNAHCTRSSLKQTKCECTFCRNLHQQNGLFYCVW